MSPSTLRLQLNSRIYGNTVWHFN